MAGDTSVPRGHQSLQQRLQLCEGGSETGAGKVDGGCRKGDYGSRRRGQIIFSFFTRLSLDFYTNHAPELNAI